MNKILIKNTLQSIEDALLLIWDELELEDPTLKNKNSLGTTDELMAACLEQEHPLGNKIDEAWLAVKVTKKSHVKNTALVWYTFPGLNKEVAYYYTPEKIYFDGGLAWEVEEGKHYIVHNQKWDYKDRWVWNKIWEIPSEVYDNIAFKVSQKIKPNDSLLRMEEDKLLNIPTDQLSPIQVRMKERALNRKKIEITL